MSRRKRPALNSETLIRKIFGPPPILENEDSAEYELLLERHYADMKPKDIAMESYLHDGAYWDWEVRRLRRMKICLVEAARTNAMAWVLGMPRSVRLRYIRGTKDADVVKPGDASLFAEKPSEAEEPSEAVKAIQLNELTENFGLINDTIMTRAFLEELDLIECIDRMLANAESRRNAAYREIHRHRAALNYEEREKIIDDAEFKVINTRKHRPKIKRQKNKNDQRTQN